MKKVTGLFAVAFSVLAISVGCDDEVDNERYSMMTDPGSVADDCCGVYHYHEVDGEAPSHGQYYYLALMQADTIVKVGQPAFVDSGDFASLNLGLDVCYRDDLSTGLVLDKYVLACDSIQHVGDLAKRTIAEPAGQLTVAEYMADTCVDCCSHPNLRYKAWAYKKNLDSVIGFDANMETSYGSLCHDEATPAMQASWIGIQNSLGVERTAFIQYGWMQKRWPEGVVDTMVYIEILGINEPSDYLFLPADGSYPEFWIECPGHGEHHRYRLQTDPQTGNVHFLYDYIPQFALATQYWVGRTMSHAGCVTEIQGRETDMPGLPWNPHTFSDCRYVLDDGYDSHRARFSYTDDFVGSTPQDYNHYEEWEASIEAWGDIARMWDNVPLE